MAIFAAKDQLSELPRKNKLKKIKLKTETTAILGAAQLNDPLALAELGYEWITARIQPNSVKVIDLARPDQIPVVHSGLMKQQELHNFYQPYLSNVSDRFPQRLHMT